jgi:hypothetical protein
VKLDAVLYRQFKAALSLRGETLQARIAALIIADLRKMGTHTFPARSSSASAKRGQQKSTKEIHRRK